MAKQYVVTEEEFQSLIESLELHKLRKQDELARLDNVRRQEVSDMHRSFHFHVTTWVQNMGYKGHRG